ncbi:MAG TPA: efflux RND transporter permease subunit, partial [Pedomonas sp.]|uniref:efflux RND transporter permease subunit n=1 Tax=Pedomonas sp. TaxID=2976421 RepID=UPI002F41DE85
GVLPLLFASGAGAVSRFSLGLVIASGMTIGTLFTLFIVPVVYSFLAGDHRPKQAAGSKAPSGSAALPQPAPAPVAE